MNNSQIKKLGEAGKKASDAMRVFVLSIGMEKRLGLKKTDKSSGSSFILDCTFWETEREGVYLTDYDEVSNTKTESFYFLHYQLKGKRNKMIISSEMLSDREYFYDLIDNELIY